jgi:dienelactone hydrolase
MQTLEYAPGRLADVFGDPGTRTVLLWHGMQTDARAAVRPLAQRLAAHGVGVVAPDWNSHADDRGRDDLLRSADLAVRRADGDLVLAGWSLGGAAAAGLTLDADRYGIRVARTVTLGGAFTAPDPLSGRPPADLLPGGGATPFLLLHGVSDDVIAPAAGRDFAAALQRHGWPVDVVEIDADHATIVGARYDADGDRYLPADDAAALDTAEAVARRMLAA